jgi:hypothetical protein
MQAWTERRANGLWVHFGGEGVLFIYERVLGLEEKDSLQPSPLPTLNASVVVGRWEGSQLGCTLPLNPRRMGLRGYLV